MATPSTAEIEKMTPMMRQYYELKAQTSGAILFFRMGDFYEIFADDAELIAPVLEIVLTSRDSGSKKRVPFCGVPHHSAKAYWLKLLKQGYKVAIADQVEDPALTKGLVKREIVRTLTPGCIDELEGLESDKPNYMMASYENPKDKSWAISLADISTGELRLGSVENIDALKSVVLSMKPKELLVRKFQKEFLESELSAAIEFDGLLIDTLPESVLRSKAEQTEILKEVFSIDDLKKDLSHKIEGGIEVVSGLLTYLKTLKASLSVFKKIVPLHDPETMNLSEIVIRDLELFETVQKRTVKGSLFHQINHTLSPMGARLMRWSLARPLLKKDAIEKRHEAISCLLGLGEEALENLRKNLKGCADLERLATRTLAGKSIPLELARMRDTLLKAKWIDENIIQMDKNLKENPLLSSFKKGLLAYKKPLSLLERSILEHPQNLGEGSLVFKEGYNSDLDAKNHLAKNGQSKVSEYEKDLKTKTQINSLKIKKHKTFGLIIEVTKSNLSKVTDDFIRRQTMVNCERFVTTELKDLDELLTTAQEKSVMAESAQYFSLLEELSSHHDALVSVARFIALFDMLQSFAWLAVKFNYSRPEISEDETLDIRGSRHPVVENFVGKHKFTTNDIYMDAHQKQMLITGPNMAGKSTIMRQLAIIALIHQSGGFVPAESARIPLFDGVFSRVGASDNLSQGQSTFMVEMSEASEILRHATSKSLVILDEVGRGTSTEDGVAIASAIFESLSLKVNCWLMFSTHYHEMVRLANEIVTARAIQTQVIEENNKVEFTHRLIEGASGNSYGIEVAKIAGIPDDVIHKATEYLASHLKAKSTKVVAKEKEESNASVLPEKKVDNLTANQLEVIERLQRINVNRLTPLQALNIMDDLKSSLSHSADLGIFQDLHM